MELITVTADLPSPDVILVRQEGDTTAWLVVDRRVPQVTAETAAKVFSEILSVDPRAAEEI